MTMADPLVVCETLVKIFRAGGSEIVALQGLDLTIKSGELLGIVGPSGSGKSTLLNILGGLERPSAGRITVGSRELLKLSDAELDRYRRTQVGFVWQQSARNLLPGLTALQNVELPIRLSGCSQRKSRERASALLSSLGLDKRMHHRSSKLSGGEQQRVAIGIALANRPQIVLADEPTGELDGATADEIYSALRQMNLECGATMVIVSHDPDLHRHVDRIVTIRDGQTSTEITGASRQADNLRSLSNLSVRPARAKTSSGFDELAMLDTAGRLQIPPAYRDLLGIGDRVRLEPTDRGLMLRPIENGQGGRTEPTAMSQTSNELYWDEDVEPPQSNNSLVARARELTRRIFRST